MVTVRRKPRGSDEGLAYRVPVSKSQDIVTARQAGRALASRLSFSSCELTFIATAISEVARNIVEHAGQGEVVLESVSNGSRRGVSVVARDRGPGISDIRRALQPGFSTGRGLGLGLAGSRLLMDEFTITSTVGVGTTVTMRKWAP